MNLKARGPSPAPSLKAKYKKMPNERGELMIVELRRALTPEDTVGWE